MGVEEGHFRSLGKEGGAGVIAGTEKDKEVLVRPVEVIVGYHQRVPGRLKAPLYGLPAEYRLVELQLKLYNALVPNWARRSHDVRDPCVNERLAGLD